jgi:hypothetical protein
MNEKRAKKRSQKKEAIKQKVEISLWICSVKYEYGILCTFCTKNKAFCYCPDCKDFYCGTCDNTAHLTKKRKDHIRSTLSTLTLNKAAGFVIRAVRFFGHLRTLQKKCRLVFKRHLDKKSLNYYYYNPVYGTVSWRKPFCLRKNELFPFMEKNYAASKCQNLYYLWLSRVEIRKQLALQYRKIFDRRSGNFYYTYNGLSKLVSKQSWKKPHFYGFY